MRNGTPVVLVASVSAYDGQALELALEKTGWDLLRIQDADEAARELHGAEGHAVLVIDSGLLEMTHDPQWRLLRTDHPGVGTVVRCLVPRDPRLRKREGGTFLAHPDDLEGMCRAVRAVGGPVFASA